MKAKDLFKKKKNSCACVCVVEAKIMFADSHHREFLPASA